ncbi:MAG TPA: hypothetical protein VFS34_04150, partial [Thermoanaerobaculia bacterium]|nr:hypothetical protein [Thermoanaerobaculia bacterium]
MSGRSAAPSVPPVLLGTIGGAIAAIPVVPLVRELALRLGSVPGIPGAENAARDVKGATFAEIAAIVVAIPAFSFFFGRALPGFLERRARPGRLSFQWAGAAAALASWLWKRGVVPAVAIPSGIVLGLLAAGFVLAFRNRFAVRRLLSRRHRWRIAAIGGTGAAWELARLSNPGGARPIARNPILDLAIAAAVALIAGAFLARIRGRFAAGLERTAAACGLSLPLAAIAIAFPRTLPFALAAAAGVFLVSSWIGLSGRPRLLGAGALLVLGACGWTTYYQPYSPVNLFEDGHALGFAKAYLSGASPFRDTYPIHGWGVDGGVDALAFRWTSATLEVFRIRRAAFTALALPALAAASVAALGSLGWGTAALVLFLATCPFVSERSLFAIVALGFLAAGVRRERARYLVLAGVFAAAGIFFALDMGIIVLAGGILGLGLVAVSLRRAAPVVGFLSGAVIGAIPFLGI